MQKIFAHLFRLGIAISTISAITASTLTLAQPLPKIKAGLWESTTITEGGDAAKTKGNQMKTQVCMNDEVMSRMIKMGQSMTEGMCSKQDFSMRGKIATGSVECKLGSSIMRSNSVTTFTNDTAYRTESTATFTPPMMGMKESKTTVNAIHIGACRADMKPGDMMMNGKKVNLLDMAKSAAKK